MTRTPVIAAATLLVAWVGGAAGGADDAATTRPAKTPEAYVVVLNFVTEGVRDPGGQVPLGKRPAGVRLADALRLRLRRHEEYEVVDRLTTEQLSEPTGADADPEAIAELMQRRLGANLGLYGTVAPAGEGLRATVRCLDLTNPDAPGGWTRRFTDRSERARAVLSRRIVELIRGRSEWAPPEVGDEPEPDALGEPLNANGGFEKGAAGWDRPDNVSTFIQRGSDRRGNVLRVRTDLKREPWLAYRRALRMGRADPSAPPEIASDTSFGSVAGLEGVHFRSAFIRAHPGRRYWLTVDRKGPDGAKVFIKGFRATPHARDGLPESALAELDLTPEQFADLPPERRRELIDADAEKHPKRYLRECWRWHLNCEDAADAWTHFAEPFPPRGGLGENVEWLQIQIYSYWPPGEYLWDDVHIYLAPKKRPTSAPADESAEKPEPRTTDGDARQVERSIDESRAQTKLGLARSYLKMGMERKAGEALRSILTDYPDTDAAEAARKELRELE
ncbi:MAG: hypothetical protein ACOC8F_05320 [Planctomycetota bacterium]